MEKYKTILELKEKLTQTETRFLSEIKETIIDPICSTLHQYKQVLYKTVECKKGESGNILYLAFKGVDERDLEKLKSVLAEFDIVFWHKDENAVRFVLTDYYTINDHSDEVYTSYSGLGASHYEMGSSYAQLGYSSVLETVINKLIYEIESYIR